MNGQDINVLLSKAAEAKHELPERIQALEELAQAGNKEIAPRLRDLWKRKKPPSGKTINWDPEAVERVVDLYVILALYKCGDPSLLSQIAVRVAQAEDILEGPYSELGNAATVIRAIGRPEPVEQLVALSASQVPREVANAVRTLQLLNLPSPPSGGSLTEFPELTSPVSFTIHRLQEELQTIARLSNGRVLLSDGTKAVPDYERGEVRREDTNLAEILTQEIDMLDLTYAVTHRGVAICTFKEAGARWRQRWPEYSKQLVWKPGN